MNSPEWKQEIAAAVAAAQSAQVPETEIVDFLAEMQAAVREDGDMRADALAG